MKRSRVYLVVLLIAAASCTIDEKQESITANIDRTTTGGPATTPERMPLRPAQSTAARQAKAAEMYRALAPRLSRSPEGLRFEQRPDGLKTVKLQGRFQHVTLLRRTPDGRFRTACVDNPRAAAAAIGYRPTTGDAR